MGDSIKITGIDKVKARLKKLIDTVAGATDEAVSDFADEVVLHMQKITPVDTGKLKGSIAKKQEGDGWTVGPRNVKYADYVENGTSNMRAQPYVAPTMAWAKQTGPKRVAKQIEGVIEGAD